MRAVLFILLAGLVVGCRPADPEKPEKTQLEIRQLQTRTYDVEDLRLVMKSILNVLQDDGYIVKNVALDLGFLSANKEMDIEDHRNRLWAQIGRPKDARWDKNELIEATVNVSEFGKQMRVRANFQEKKFDNRGAVSTVKPI